MELPGASPDIPQDSYTPVTHQVIPRVLGQTPVPGLSSFGSHVQIIWREPVAGDRLTQYICYREGAREGELREAWVGSRRAEDPLPPIHQSRVRRQRSRDLRNLLTISYTGLFSTGLQISSFI